MILFSFFFFLINIAIMLICSRQWRTWRLRMIIWKQAVYPPVHLLDPPALSHSPQVLQIWGVLHHDSQWQCRCPKATAEGGVRRARVQFSVLTISCQVRVFRVFSPAFVWWYLMKNVFNVNSAFISFNMWKMQSHYFYHLKIFPFLLWSPNACLKFCHCSLLVN